MSPEARTAWLWVALAVALVLTIVIPVLLMTLQPAAGVKVRPAPPFADCSGELVSDACIVRPG